MNWRELMTPMSDRELSDTSSNHTPSKTDRVIPFNIDQQKENSIEKLKKNNSLSKFKLQHNLKKITQNYKIQGGNKTDRVQTEPDENYKLKKNLNQIINQSFHLEKFKGKNIKKPSIDLSFIQSPNNQQNTINLIKQKQQCQQMAPKTERREQKLTASPDNILTILKSKNSSHQVNDFDIVQLKESSQKLLIDSSQQIEKSLKSLKFKMVNKNQEESPKDQKIDVQNLTFQQCYQQLGKRLSKEKNQRKSLQSQVDESYSENKSLKNEIYDIKRMVNNSQQYFQNLLQKLTRLEEEHINSEDSTLVKKQSNNSQSYKDSSFDIQKYSTTDRESQIKKFNQKQSDPFVQKKAKTLHRKNLTTFNLNLTDILDQKQDNKVKSNNRNSSQYLQENMLSPRGQFDQLLSINKSDQNSLQSYENKVKVIDINEFLESKSQESDQSSKQDIQNEDKQKGIMRCLNKLMKLIPQEDDNDELEKKIEKKIKQLESYKEKYGNELFEIKMENGLYQQQFQDKIQSDHIDESIQHEIQ